MTQGNLYNLYLRLRRNHTLAIVGIILLTAAIYWRWLSFGFFTNSDWSFSYTETLQALKYPSLWRALGFVGAFDDSAFRAPVIAIIAGLAHFGWGSNVTDKFIFLWPQIFVLPIVGYLFCYHLVKNKAAALAGAAVISLNLYFLTIDSVGHNLITIAVAFSIYGLLFLLKFIDSAAYFHVVISALFFAVAGYYDFRIVYASGFVAFLLIPFCFSKLSLRDSVLGYGLLGLLLLLLNIFWLLPIPFNSGGFASDVLSRPLFGDQFWSLSSALTLVHPFWSGSRPTWFVAQSISPIYWFLPIFVAFGIISTRKKLLPNMFAVLALIGILLVKQSDAPFAGLYQWLYSHIPGFNAFREATKFFYFIAVAYGVIAAYFFAEIYSAENVREKGVKYFAPLILFLGLFLLNGYPLISGSIQTMFKQVKIDPDYGLIRNFLNNDTSFSRTLWVPSDSRFIVTTPLHPKGAAVSFLGLSAVSEASKNIPEKEIQERIFYFLSSSYLSSILSASSFRYIGVPVQDKLNDDDFFQYYGGSTNSDVRNAYISALDRISWLRKVDIGTRDIILYENKAYRPLVSASVDLTQLESVANISEKLSFIDKQLASTQDFFVSNKQSYFPVSKLKILFEDLRPTDITGQGVIASTSRLGNKTLLFDVEPLADRYLTSTTTSLSISDQSTLTLTAGALNAALPTVPAVSYTSKFQEGMVLDSGGVLTSVLPTNSSSRLTTTAFPVSLLKLDPEEYFPNGSFENGLWGTSVNDCNAYDDRPNIKQGISEVAYAGTRSLELTAARHIACTSTSTAVLTPGQYILSVAYQSSNATMAGLYLSLSALATPTVSEKLPITGAMWNIYNKSFVVPSDSTKATLYLYAYATDDVTPVSVRYDGISLKKLQSTTLIPSRALSVPEPQVLPNAAAYNFVANDPARTLQNLVLNGDLEAGLWSAFVGDCNNYDNAPGIGMRLLSNDSDQNTASAPINSGVGESQMLQLTATRHIACSGPAMVPVKASASYLFSFDYSSLSQSPAGYYIGWSGTSSPPIRGRLPTKDRGTHTFTEQIKVPAGAKGASIVLYSYETDGVSENLVNYDNVSLIELPNISNRYYLFDSARTEFSKPRSVSFDESNPTHIPVKISGATTAFYLNYAESFHPQWQLMLNNAAVATGLSKWSPWAMPNRVGDDAHFALDDFLNGWYVDPVGLCAIDTAKEAPLAAAAQAKAQAAARAGGHTAALSGADNRFTSSPESLAKDTRLASMTGPASANVATSSVNLTPLQQYGVRPRQNVGLSNSSTSTPFTSQSNSIAFSVNTSESTTSARSTATTTSKTKTASSSASTTASATTLATTSDSSSKTSVTTSAESDAAPLTSLAPNGVRPLQNIDLSTTTITVFATSTPAADQSNMREGCIRNEDGSYDIEMIIEFWPQRWFYVGLVISGTTLFLCLAYLLLVGIRPLVRRFNPRAQRAKAAAERTAAHLQNKASLVEFMPEYQAGPTRASAQPGLVLAPVWNRSTNGTMPARKAAATAIGSSANREIGAAEEDFAIRGIGDFFLVMARGVYIAWRRVARRPLRMVTVLALAGAAGWYWGISAGLLWGLFLFFALYRLDSRVVGSLAIVTLVVCPVLLSLGSEWGDTTAEEVAVYAYFFLVMTVVLQILEYRRQAKREARLASRQGL